MIIIGFVNQIFLQENFWQGNVVMQHSVVEDFSDTAGMHFGWVAIIDDAKESHSWHSLFLVINLVD